MVNKIKGYFLRWAVHPSDIGKILYVEGKHGEVEKPPHVDDVVTRPFLIDPESKQPIPVRVVDVVNLFDRPDPCIAVVVVRADQLQ